MRFGVGYTLMHIAEYVFREPADATIVNQPEKQVPRMSTKTRECSDNQQTGCHTHIRHVATPTTITVFFVPTAPYKAATTPESTHMCAIDVSSRTHCHNNEYNYRRPSLVDQTLLVLLSSPCVWQLDSGHSGPLSSPDPTAVRVSATCYETVLHLIK